MSKLQIYMIVHGFDPVDLSLAFLAFLGTHLALLSVLTVRLPNAHLQTGFYYTGVYLLMYMCYSCMIIDYYGLILWVCALFA